MELRPRRVKPVPPQLGSYFRPSQADHTVLLQLLSERLPAALEGIVFDPGLEERQAELRQEVLHQRVEAVLDTKAMELAMPGGRTRRVLKLPWAGDYGLHTPTRLRGDDGRRLVSDITEWLKARQFSAVLAPTHFLEAGAADPWLPVDRDLAHMLRESLDAASMGNVPIYYPLAIPGKLFYDGTAREAIRWALSSLPIDGIWLRIHPFGTASGPRVVRRYIEASSSFHGGGLPLVADRVGTVGLALLAFGAVGGIESGITLGENFDARRLTRPPKKGKNFGPQFRVYLQEAQAFLGRAEARRFFENRSMKAHFACKDSSCCPRGATDTIADPRRHFLICRLREVARLGNLPEVLRPSRYLEEVLRPATDKVIRAAKVAPSLEASRRRLEAWRYTLGSLAETSAQRTFSAVPEGRRLRTKIGA